MAFLSKRALGQVLPVVGIRKEPQLLGLRQHKLPGTDHTDRLGIHLEERNRHRKVHRQQPELESMTVQASRRAKRFIVKSFSGESLSREATSSAAVIDDPMSCDFELCVINLMEV